MRPETALLLLLAGSAMPAAALDELQGPPKQERLEIVDRAIEHHGGNLYTASETRMSLCSKAGCSQITAITDGWDFDLEATARVGDGVRRARITNDTVEQWMDGEAVEVAAERRSPGPA